MSDEGGFVDKKQHVANYSLKCARLCLETGKYGRAFAHFLLVLQLDPMKKGDQEIQALFLLAFQCFTDELEQTGRIEDLFKCFEQSRQVFPECDPMLNDMGVRLFRLGYYDEAAGCFRKALQLNKNSLKAEENLENLSCHLVERWHFRMLNDARRNLSFKVAICKAVLEGHTSVLDIGTGTGLLSLFALSAGAEHVYGCEMSPTMYSLTCDVLSANHMREKVIMIPKKSTDVSIPNDMKERVSLIVTETFDAGLLGEHILTTISHAQQHLLSTCSDKDQVIQIGKIIPSKADVYICGIECDSVNLENRFLSTSLCNLDCSGLEITCSTGFSEPYTSEKLNYLRSGYRELTDRIKFTEIDFNNAQKYISCDTEALCHIQQVELISDGRLDAIALWFDLHLDDKIKLSSSPDSDSCWEQAVFPVHPSHLAGQDMNASLKVQKGSFVTVQGDIMENVFHITCTQIISDDHDPKIVSHDDEFHSNSELNNESLMTDYVSDSDSKKQNESAIMHGENSAEPVAISAIGSLSPNTAKSIQSSFHLEREEIGKLNDTGYINAFHLALSRVKDKIKNPKDFTFYNISEGFSPFSLCAAKLGAKLVKSKHQKPGDKQTMDLLTQLARVNDIDYETLWVEGDYPDADHKKWASILMADFIEPSGVVAQQIFQDILFARIMFLKPDAFIIPNQVEVYGMLIESESLLSDSLVMDNCSTLGYKVAEFMNVFQGKTHVDIDLFTLPHKRLSEPFRMLTLDTNFSCQDKRIENILSSKNKLKIITTNFGTITAVIYWFELILIDDIKLSTLEKTSHWKQAAVMQRERLLVSANIEVDISVKCEAGVINVMVNNNMNNLM